MASGKRASMREGPLAALFRSTEEGKAERAPSRRSRAPRGDPRRARRRRGRRASSRPREPSAAAEGAVRATRACPTPEERLRHVFSSEIPENILDRPADRRRGRSTADDQEPIHQPGSPLTQDPVLRVVGVGGAGVNAVDRMIEADDQRRRVHRGQHGHAVAGDLAGADARAHRQRLDPRPRCRCEPGDRPPGGARAVRRAQGPAQGRGHDLHRGRSRRRHRHGRCAGRRADRPRGRCADRRHRDQAVRLRGRAPRRAGRRRASTSSATRSTR